MKFKIYVKNKFNNNIIITDFDPVNEHHNLYSTFNEKITHNDNDQISLTFSLTRKIIKPDGTYEVNPFLRYLIFGKTLYLKTERGLFELIISQIAPKSSKDNTIYEYTCQDLISYKWSRMKLGYSYNTMERGGVKTLFEIATDILSDCQLGNWQIARLNSHLYPNDRLKNEKITLNVENTNPYNALIEALNALNASMMVDYENHKIRFYQKDRVLFSGYRYRPETNLRSINATYNIDELTTILHVQGGTDEKGIYVTLTPAIPDAVRNFLTDSLYILPNDTYNNLASYVSNNYLPLYKDLEKWVNKTKDSGLTVDFLTNGIQAYGKYKLHISANTPNNNKSHFLLTENGRAPINLPSGCYSIYTTKEKKDTTTYKPVAWIAIHKKEASGDENKYFDNGTTYEKKYVIIPEHCNEMYADFRFDYIDTNTGDNVDCTFKPQIKPIYVYLVDENNINLYERHDGSGINLTFVSAKYDETKVPQAYRGCSDLSHISHHNGIKLQSGGIKTTSDNYRCSAFFDTSGDRIKMQLPKGRYRLHLNYNNIDSANNNLVASMFMECFTRDDISLGSLTVHNTVNDGVKDFTIDQSLDNIYLQIRLIDYTNGQRIAQDTISVFPYIECLDNYDDNYNIPGIFNYCCPKPNNNVNKNDYSWSAYLNEIDEINQFLAIAEKIPNLGQFLHNFDFFRQNGLMTEQQYKEINQIINLDMRKINTKLKPLTTMYYNASWEMNKILIQAEVYLEQINAAYASIKMGEEGLENDIKIAESNLNNLFQSVFFNYYYRLYSTHYLLKNGDYVPEIQTIINKIENNINARISARYYYEQKQLEYKKKYGLFFENSVIDTTKDNEIYDYDKINLQGDILYYKDKYYLLLQMCGIATDINDFFNNNSAIQYNPNKDDDYLTFYTIEGKEQLKQETELNNGILVNSYYANLFYYFVNRINNDKTSKEYGIYNIILDLENENKKIWSKLYQNYSQFIYESSYENADELNSIALYNQAINYFENYHHPKSSYSVEILNLEQLEQIGTPNLRVNSRIRVFNEDLDLDEGTTYYTNEEGVKLNNISYTTNELIITSLSYELRKSQAMSITVERIIQYQTILQKLIKSIK